MFPYQRRAWGFQPLNHLLPSDKSCLTSTHFSMGIAFGWNTFKGSSKNTCRETGGQGVASPLVAGDSASSCSHRDRPPHLKRKVSFGFFGVKLPCPGSGQNVPNMAYGPWFQLDRNETCSWFYLDTYHLDHPSPRRTDLLTISLVKPGARLSSFRVAFPQWET